SIHAVLATLLKGGSEKVWKIRAAEMIKAIPRGGPGVGEVGTAHGRPGRGYFGCFEELQVPIIENRSREEDLREELERAMREFPEACAVLVRRHGVYVWGETVWKAKTQCERYVAFCFFFFFFFFLFSSSSFLLQEGEMDCWRGGNWW